MDGPLPGETAMLLTLKITCLIAVTVLIAGNFLLGHLVIGSSLVITCGLPLCKSLGDDIGRRLAKYDQEQAPAVGLVGPVTRGSIPLRRNQRVIKRCDFSGW